MSADQPFDGATGAVPGSDAAPPETLNPPWYSEHIPPPGLAGVVECVWQLRDLDAPATPQRVLPDGRVEIVFNLGYPFEEVRHGRFRLQPLDLVVGPTSSHIAIRPTGKVDLVGIRLRPGAARGLVSGPMYHLRDSTGSGDRLAVELGGLRERLVARQTPEGRAAEVWRTLEPVVRGRAVDPRARRVCGWIESGGGRVPVAELAVAAGMSVRTLHRLLQRELGVSARCFAGLVRFQRALATLRPDGRPVEPHAWLGVGYFDQSHFLRDFRRFAGTSPGRYFAGEDNRLANEFAPLAR